MEDFIIKNNKNLLRGLFTLKEEIFDRNSGRKCTLCKAWNMILTAYNGENMSALLSMAEERFVMEDYQFGVICDLAKALEIICREE